jgi:hypothetical protein
MATTFFRHAFGIGSGCALIPRHANKVSIDTRTARVFLSFFEITSQTVE